jgi:hypothetical protein
VLAVVLGRKLKKSARKHQQLVLKTTASASIHKKKSDILPHGVEAHDFWRFLLPYIFVFNIKTI